MPEYGTAQDPKQFPFIYKYSPYQHVEKGTKYPAVLLVSNDFDTRVDPLHARKMKTAQFMYSRYNLDASSTGLKWKYAETKLPQGYPRTQ